MWSLISVSMPSWTRSHKEIICLKLRYAHFKHCDLMKYFNSQSGCIEMSVEWFYVEIFFIKSGPHVSLSTATFLVWFPLTSFKMTKVNITWSRLVCSLLENKHFILATTSKFSTLFPWFMWTNFCVMFLLPFPSSVSNNLFLFLWPQLRCHNSNFHLKFSSGKCRN